MAAGPNQTAAEGGEPPAPESPGQLWKRQLTRRKNGEPNNDEHNAILALRGAPELIDLFRYDEFSDQIEVLRPLPGMPRDSLNVLFQDDEPTLWSDEHLIELTQWLQGHGFAMIRRNVVQDAVVNVAKAQTYHPVRQYLEECERDWDRVPRLDWWLKRYFGAKDHAAYLEVVGPKFMIGAVARVMQPGCQMDTSLVLEGDQGLGKSTAVVMLGAGWARDIAGDLSNKDAEIFLAGVWLAEMAELTAIKRSEQEAVKGFLSRRIGRYRPPYGRNAVDHPRQCVFIATTNQADYLIDPTGARRFWPVECGTIDLPALAQDVRQLWGEAVARYALKETWHLDPTQSRRAMVEQSARTQLSPIDSMVLEYADEERRSGRLQINMRSLLELVFEFSSRKEPQKAGALAQQASRALVRDGWRRMKPTGRGPTRQQCYTWNLSAELEPQHLNGSSQASQASQAESEDSSIDENLASQASQASQAESAYPDDDIPF